MRQYIGKVAIEDADYPGEDLYSDGAIEEELLSIVTQYPERAYNQVIKERKNWALLYHLSPVRHNLVEWLPITKDHALLEVGAGCGAVTGAFADKAAHVTCIELSRRRSAINATRNRARENIEILLGNFQDVEAHLEKSYDWVTLIGVFEYGQAYIDSQDPYVDFLKCVKKHLKPGGRVAIAIENRLGLKYFAGCPEDHTGNFYEGIEGYPQKPHVRTFSKPELARVIARAGLCVQDFYYPYPDYKLPSVLYSDQCLPKPGELLDNLRNFDRRRYLNFDEALAFDSLIQDGLFPLFSNSFLVIAGSWHDVPSC